MSTTTIHRRHFLGLSASLFATSLGAQQPLARFNQPVCIFTKGLQSLSYDQLAEQIADLGVDGIEATIREGGHIEPEQVPDELPKMVEALRRHKLEITVMASSINDASAPHTEQTLRAAARLGIKRYRMQYFRYSEDRSIAAQHKEWHAKLQELAALNKELGIRGLYQNHAGEKYFGAAIWDLAAVLEGISAADLAVAYDVRHATVEGGTSWPIALRKIRPHIDTVYAKDFVWDGPKMKNVPLGSGRVDYPRFLSMLKKSGYDGPISLHVEYVDHRDPSLVGQHLAANRRDLDTLRMLYSRAS